MKKIILVVVALVGAYYAYQPFPQISAGQPTSQPANAELYEAISEQRTSFQVEGSGRVVRLLSDDNDGSRHQRFILELETGQTLLVAHNIDVAPRVNGLNRGDKVSFFGEYEWNERGGVIHWTHRDTRGSHVAGWIEHNGQRYQ